MSNPKSRYNDSTKIAAMTLWAQGHTYPQIAEKLEIFSWRTVENWKRARYPECWDTLAEKLRKNSVEKMETIALDSLAQVLARQQKQLDKIQKSVVEFIVKRARSNKLSDKVAGKLLMWSFEAQKALYLSNDQWLNYIHSSTKL